MYDIFITKSMLWREGFVMGMEHTNKIEEINPYIDVEDLPKFMEGWNEAKKLLSAHYERMNRGR